MTNLSFKSLHHSLIEHLNVELVLQTITNLKTAVNWLKSTFLYVRIKKNPQHYGIQKNQSLNQESDFSESDKYLSELCIKNLTLLMEADLLEKCDFFKNPLAELKPTRNGYLMAKYSLAFDTMKAIIFNLSNKRDKNDQDDLDISLDSAETEYQPCAAKSLQDLVIFIFDYFYFKTLLVTNLKLKVEFSFVLQRIG